MLDEIDTLDELWELNDRIHKEKYPDTKLAPIVGGGKTQNPMFMFIFINPTYRNVSSDPFWQGKRRPWTGTNYIWRIFNRAGHFDQDLLIEIRSKRKWDVEFSNKVYKHLSDRGFYFTNIVKWTGENADLPKPKKIKTFVPILKKEINIVDPEYIVTFGHIPFSHLVREKIRLSDYYNGIMDRGELYFYETEVYGKEYRVIPSYFPVGRGNPKRAIDILKLLPEK